MSLLQHLNGVVDFLHQAIAAIGASHPTVAQLQRQQVEHLRSTFARSSPTLQESAEVLRQLAHPMASLTDEQRRELAEARSVGSIPDDQISLFAPLQILC